MEMDRCLLKCIFICEMANWPIVSVKNLETFITQIIDDGLAFCILVDAFRKKHNIKSLGMPHFVGNGSHEINKIKHRFLVMPRYGQDIWSLFLENNRKMPLHTVYRLALQMVSHKL